MAKERASLTGGPSFVSGYPVDNHNIFSNSF
jgi:hypothetical protein